MISDTSEISNASIFTVELTFSNPIQKISISNLVIENGTATNLSGDLDKFSFDVTPTNDGIITISLPEGSVENFSNVKNSATNMSRTIDRIAPTINYRSMTPASPHWNPTPSINVFSSEHTTARLFNDADCTTSISDTTTIPTSIESSITLTGISAPSTIQIFAKAKDVAGNESACTVLTSYNRLKKFIDPHASPGNGFGSTIVELANGNIAITSPFADPSGVTDAGAVYLFNGGTGALISQLVGSTTNDRVGINGITKLTNGNFVISSPKWNCTSTSGCTGSTSSVGAVTFASAATGISGNISSSNSLIGTNASDEVGMITALTNGNYVVASPLWDCSAASGCSGNISNVGSVTWGNGNTGVSGSISSSNSLLGGTANDNFGIGGIYPLTNGNFVASSSVWDCSVTAGCSGAIADVGAATWVSGTAGAVGFVSTTNSLVGSTLNDNVGRSEGVIPLENGNYVVVSYRWDCIASAGCSGTIANVGAVTWASGTSGIVGNILTSNSLVGSTQSDYVGISGVTPLANGNYVISSYQWDCIASAGCSGTILNVGAVTWGSGTSGISGSILTTNSLIGGTSQDYVGFGGVKSLPNGNYVVVSSSWNCSATAGCSGAVDDVGAITWGTGTTGTAGFISSSNSLVGATADDQIGSGGIIVLNNSNYVINSYDWDCTSTTGCSGNLADVGAVTWRSGTVGTAGFVSSSNSLIGSTIGDQVGLSGVLKLGNSNYIVKSKLWDCISSAGCTGSIADVGAVTWGSGTAGISGAVSLSNSLIGSTASDQIGTEVIELSNNNYVVASKLWDCSIAAGCAGAISNAGAVTFALGNTGVAGQISSTNSLIGNTEDDQIGTNVKALNLGRYLVNSPFWDCTISNGCNALKTNVGAISYSTSTNGMTGIVNTSNCSLGSTSGDMIGIGETFHMSDGSYLIDSALVSGSSDGFVNYEPTMFYAPLGLRGTGIEIQLGAKKRAYIRYVDINFNRVEGVSDLLQPNRIKFEFFSLDARSLWIGSGSSILGTETLSQVGTTNVIRADFGASGIAGTNNTTAGEGIYRVLVDVNNDGDFIDLGESFEFYRLLGDVDQDGVVSYLDVDIVTPTVGQSGANLETDLDGNGAVNATDRTYILQNVGKKINENLKSILDD